MSKCRCTNCSDLKIKDQECEIASLKEQAGSWVRRYRGALRDVRKYGEIIREKEGTRISQIDIIRGLREELDEARGAGRLYWSEKYEKAMVDLRERDKEIKELVETRDMQKKILWGLRKDLAKNDQADKLADEKHKHNRLKTAVSKLYSAAQWFPDRACDGDSLWEDVKYAAELSKGKSPGPVKKSMSMFWFEQYQRHDVKIKELTAENTSLAGEARAIEGKFQRLLDAVDTVHCDFECDK